MNLFKKIFGKKEKLEETNNDKTPYENEVIIPFNLTQEDLTKLKMILEPTIKNATKIILEKSNEIENNSNIKSQFGGEPYFEIDESWPQSKAGVNLSFVFQIYNSEGFDIPKKIKLIQFFYDFEEMPWCSDDDGWLMKIYEELNPERVIRIEKPKEQEKINYCEIKFKKVKSLPDWEGLDLHNKVAFEYICKLETQEPFETYDEIVKELTGQEDYQSQIGGYPRWVQGESTPENENQENLNLLLQIDTEDEAGLMWGDVGLIYFFYNEKNKKIEFELQCH